MNLSYANVTSSTAPFVPDASRSLWQFALGMLLVMNLLDACFTLSWVCLGQASEANPAMALCLEQGPTVFMAVKMVLVAASVWGVRKLRRHFLAQLGVGACLTAYAAVMVTHLSHLVS